MRGGKPLVLAGGSVLVLVAAVIGFRMVNASTKPISTPSPTGSAGTPPTGTAGLAPLVFAVTGSCTTAGGTLSARGSGFTVGGTYSTRAWHPDGRPYELAKISAAVTSDGGVSWTWPCAGDPPGEYTTQLTDERTGRTTGLVRFTVQAARPGFPSPKASDVARRPASPSTSRRPIPGGEDPLHVALSANRAGAPVFADTSGTPASGVPDRIPFGHEVKVACKIKNASPLTSVTYWYLLRGAPWDGLYAPSDVFANGDPLGSNGTTNVDPAIPDC
ncbi:hypothetical protein [Micromonospora aurantiaca (nom. illeg.)]|uniref:hypothetical protein n=1 Tax=Micromonospora aurantiaca (nom. illeg.) TaxID=47850 RepID=UPI00365BD9F1